MRRGLALAMTLALALVACGPREYVDPLKPPEAAGRPVEKADEPAADAAGDGERTARADPTPPHIYMAIQPGDDGAISVVFAIDKGRNKTPGDDPAIRLTPEDGKCNPQELRRFAFPGQTAEKPVFGPDQVKDGVTAKELPRFMAMSVTADMLRQGLVTDVEASKPQNVCTRKLWERLIVTQNERSG